MPVEQVSPLPDLGWAITAGAVIFAGGAITTTLAVAVAVAPRELVNLAVIASLPALVPEYANVAWPLAFVIPVPESAFAPVTENSTGWPETAPPGFVIAAVTTYREPTVLVPVDGDSVIVGATLVKTICPPLPSTPVSVSPASVSSRLVHSANEQFDVNQRPCCPE